jgi:hypothetical protein
MTIRPATHERLTGVVSRWRVAEHQHAALIDDDPTGQRRVLANAYRECANDLDLALRDDETIQPRKRK